MNFITLILIFVHGLLAEEVYLPDGKLFNLPKPEEYSYFLEDEYPSSLERLYVLSPEHANAFLSCPKGYAMLKMRQELVDDKNFNNTVFKGVAKHTASLLESSKQGHTFYSPCPVIYDCLGYQACLFIFNHHFCPDLTSLPFILLNIVCYRDSFAVVPEKFKKQKDLVLNIYERITFEYDMQYLKHQEIPEKLVFDGHCSSPNTAIQTEGFFGNCSQNPPSKNVVIQQLWPLLGRTMSHDCRDQLMQIYCAFQYNNQGLCLPPVYHNKINKTGQIFSYSVLPKVGQKLKNNHLLSKQTSLNANTRLAFMIMVFNDSKSTMELIRSIYREDFFYIIHVNKQNPNIKKELNQLIVESNLPNQNILILSDERSFVTPKASYEIVRAQLEGFEELLNLGFWDFVINLYENDIPLRNVDDLALALTPYRGSSFLSSLQLSVNDGNKGSPLEEFVFSACDGFIYKVSSKSVVSTNSKFRIFRAPKGGVFDREFIQYLINEKLRSSVINDYQLYLQTDVSPEESYIPTILMNSHFRDSVYIAPIQKTMLFSNENFLSYFYVCKQHSKMECSVIDELLPTSHSSFFVSFPSQPLPEIQEFAFGLAKEDYYQFLMKYLPPKMLKVLIDDALERFCAKTKMPVDNLSLESILRLYITPCLVPLDTCCASKLITSYSKITDFSYWIDVSLFNRTSEKYFDARLMLQPIVRSRFCFGDGDLRMVFISPWIGHLKPFDPQWSRFNLEIFSPLPYGPAYSNDVLIHLLFSDKTESANCKSDQKSNSAGNPLKFKNPTDSIKINLVLISPDHEKKCSTDVILSQENKKNESISSQTEGHISMKSILMPCKNMDPGQWTLQLYQIEPTKSRVYIFPVYLLDLRNEDYINIHMKEIAQLWELKYFGFIKKNDQSDFIDLEIKQTSPSSQYLSHTSGQKKTNAVKIPNSRKEKFLVGNSGFHHWYICGGGFASTFIFCMIFMLFLFRKYFRLNLLWVYILSLILVVFLQVILFFTLCEQ
ncbi:xylosyltransferase 1 [Trichonephila inaurata madagascariensis]|uniref:protein xylosyltransferase n=1 Tax=Trichonephila inaurata madagascariensis TaxID=2747483 RepID=A0A8X6X4I5_9ARAC|nr:xylosyltransferase 1 [Trichonephila inaurata madagascariensis]